MIPHIFHYCWFGGNSLPELEQQCLASWHQHMPDWEFKLWSEETFDVSKGPLYVRQAYEARKFAFVSDYVRLWALEQYGGLYMDVDFMVYRPFDDLMDKYPAFAGYEGSKRQPVMQGVIASEPHGAWVRDMLSTYQFREFIRPDGSLDLTPNTSYFTDRLISQGFVADGIEKDFYLLEENKNKENTACAEENIENNLLEVTENTHPTVVDETNVLDCHPSQPLTSELAASASDNTPNSTNQDLPVGCLQKHLFSVGLNSPPAFPFRSAKSQHFSMLTKTDKNSHADNKVFMLHVFPVHYFCPVLTTGEDVRTAETYCEHKGESSWAQKNWKGRLLSKLSPALRTKIIKWKRKLLG